MRIKAVYKKGRLRYPVELVNTCINPLSGRSEFKDAYTGKWIQSKYIKNPKLIEPCTTEAALIHTKHLFLEVLR